jgi:hypothetical protein
MSHTVVDYPNDSSPVFDDEIVQVISPLDDCNAGVQAAFNSIQYLTDAVLAMQGQTIAADTLLGNNAGTAAVPAALSVAQILTMCGINTAAIDPGITSDGSGNETLVSLTSLLPGQGAIAGHTAAIFNGSNLILASDTAFPMGDSPASMFAWYKSTTGNSVFSYGDPSGGYRGFYTGANAMLFSPGPVVTPIANPIDGNWHFIGWTYAGSGVATIYIDGVSYDASFGGPIATTSAALYLGTAPGAGNAQCDLQEVQIYGTALSGSDVLALYNSGAGVYGNGSESGIISAYHLDGNANDYVASNNGTWSGTAQYITGSEVVLCDGTYAINATSGPTSLDNGAITTDGSGNLNLGGTISIAGGAVTINGINDIIGGPTITCTNSTFSFFARILSISTSGGNSNGNLFYDPSLAIGSFVGQDDATGNIQLQSNSGRTEIGAISGTTDDGVHTLQVQGGGTSLDNGAITTDGSGKVTAQKLNLASVPTSSTGEPGGLSVGDVWANTSTAAQAISGSTSGILCIKTT